MTVTELRERLKNLEFYGFGGAEVEAWDPDSEGWYPVSGFTYGEGSPVRLYTDED